jgi:predicted nuclease with TOPRIM domain
MIVATLAVAVLFAAGCQDQEARNQNARLQAELEALKAQKSGGGNDALLALLANQNKTQDNAGLERKLNSFGEDVSAGLDKIQKQIRDNDSASGKRMDDIEGKLKQVSDLQTTITTLRGMIESLESKVKSVDPNEVLNVQRDLINKEADLRVEKQLKDAALAEVSAMKEQLAAAQAEVENLKAEMAGLQGADVSKHPMYREKEAENRKLAGELKKTQSDYENLKLRYDELEAQLRKGANPPSEQPKATAEAYDFSGAVTEVRKGSRPDGASFLLVGGIQGSVPPVGTELVVLDAKNNLLCKVKVVRHYHFDDKDEMPVEEVGCQTIDEKSSRPVAKGDTVVWIKAKEAGGGESKGAAGGD